MPPFEIAWLWDVYILHAVYSTCFSSDAVVGVLQDQIKSAQILTLWVAVCNMRQQKMVLQLAAWLRFNQTAVDGWPTWLEQFFWGQRKHGHAAHRQGACSSQSCGESPRALGQRVPLGDQQAWVQELTAKLFAEVWFLSTDHLQQQSYAMSVFATPTERGSLS